ncbi:MAG: universal stress protein [Desulfobacterales bacterium]|nr:universal stress protein [Desulfobacterales bacterium]
MGTRTALSRNYRCAKAVLYDENVVAACEMLFLAAGLRFSIPSAGCGGSSDNRGPHGGQSCRCDKDYPTGLTMLVAVDFSDCSRRALRKAAEMISDGQAAG